MRHISLIWLMTLTKILITVQDDVIFWIQEVILKNIVFDQNVWNPPNEKLVLEFDLQNVNW